MNPRFRPALLVIVLVLLAPLAPAAGEAGGLPVCTASRSQSGPRIVAKPAGGAWLAWLDQRSGYSTDVFGCRLASDGTPFTGGADQGTGLTSVTCLKRDLSLVADGSGGAFAGWADHRCVSEFGYDIYLLRLGADGTPTAGWPVNGAAVTADPGWQLRPAVTADGTGGAFVTWVDEGVTPRRVLARRVRADGTLDPDWPAGGLLLSSSVPDSARPAIGPDGAGGFYVGWDDNRAGDRDIRVQRVTSAGGVAGGWPAEGVVVCGVPGDQKLAALVTGLSGVELVWRDSRSGTPQLHASRLLSSGAGAPGWPAGGVAIAPSGAAQQEVAVSRADVGGLRLAWSEDRGDGTGPDVWAQRLDSTGTAAAGWPGGGIRVCGAAGAQFEPALTPDAANGMYVAWSDRRDSAATGTDLYVLRIGATGVADPLWPANGAALCDDTGEQREVRVTGDGRGGVLAVWTDGRNFATSGDDIAARAVDPTGPRNVRATGLVARHRDGQTFLSWNAPPGTGWSYRVYASPSPITTAGDLAAATPVGSVGDSSACDLRLTHLLGSPFGYRVEPNDPELPPGGGLFVRTVTVPGSSWYAVTATPGAFAEDDTIVPGQNALVAPIAEAPAVPRPVYQRTVQSGGRAVEIWTLWTWDEDLPGFPAMADVRGLAFDCGLVRGGSFLAPLVVGFHARRGSMLDAVGGAFLPGEWVLAPDDYLPNGDNTFWYGYHRGYDVHSTSNAPPDTGTVVGFTARRVDWTLDWVRREFPIDTTRVFTYGYSMGGMGSAQLAFRTPAKIAGVMSVIGQFDYSFLDDPAPDCWFNPGGFFRATTDELWGTVAADLPSADGPPVFRLLNETLVAGDDRVRDLPPMLVFNGRKDVNVGWAEKTRFWRAMSEHRRGGYFFWDNRDHGVVGALWQPMQSPAYLDRFRTDRSFPALSGCDLDGDPGDGTPASGDSVGTLNGPVEWDVPAETPSGWSVTLTLRALELTTSTVPAPESALVDVSPRRLQAFVIAPLAVVPYRIVRSADEAVLAAGMATADSFGVVTVPRVRVLRAGTRVELGAPAVATAAPAGGPPRLRLSCASPVRGGAFEAIVDWPAGGEGRLELLDVGGRRVLSLFEGGVAAGRQRYRARPGSLPPGLYFLSARCGDARSLRRVVALR